MKSELANTGWVMHKPHDVRPERFKVFGERASGTNFLVSVLQRNTDMAPVGPMEYGWKHGIPSMIGVADTDLQVVVFRNAISWIKSLYAKPWATHQDMHSLDFSNFIAAEWHATVQKPWHWFRLTRKDFNGVTLQMDRHPISGLPFENMMQMRNVKTAAWLGMENRNLNVVLARYEAVLDNPQGFLAEISRVYGVDVAPGLTLPEKTLGAGYGILDVDARRKEAKQMSDADAATILAELDLEQEARLGYRYGTSVGI